MELYSNVELQTGAAAPKSYNVGNKSLGVSITNYSNLAFVLSSDKQANVGNVPPFFTVNLPVAPGEILYFTQGAPTQAVSQSAMFCSVTESQSQTTPSQTPLAQVPGYVQNVSGTVTMGGIGQVTIQNTPAVTFAAGQSVDIGTITGGTVNVQNVPGSPLNVGGTVTVGNTSLQVQNTSGGTLNVAGTVQIGNTPSVNIANTVNAAITSGTVNANIQNASLNSKVTNANINTTNSAISILNPTITLQANVPQYSPFRFPMPPALYDSIYLLVQSSNNNIPYYTFFFNQATLNTHDSWTKEGPNLNLPISVQLSNGECYYGPLKLTDLVCDSIRLGIYSTISTTDTLYLQLVGKYASQQVTNPTSSPVNTQSVNQTTKYFMNAQQTQTIIPSGGYLYSLTCTFQNQLTTPQSVLISNGGNVILAIILPGVASGSSTVGPYTLDFKNGTPNNGIVYQGSTTAYCTGYGITS